MRRQAEERMGRGGGEERKMEGEKQGEEREYGRGKNRKQGTKVAQPR